MGKRSFEPFFVRQTFSHGRTEPVVVEKVKRRLAAPSAAKPAVRCPSCGAAMRVVRIVSEPARGREADDAVPEVRSGRDGGRRIGRLRAGRRPAPTIAALDG